MTPVKVSDVRILHAHLAAPTRGPTPGNCERLLLGVGLGGRGGNGAHELLNVRLKSTVRYYCILKMKNENVNLCLLENTGLL